MEQTNKIKLLVLFTIILLVSNYSYGIDYANPKDLPTIEALIELHKQMKKHEKSSLTQVATITAEQEVTTDITKKISDIKTTINKKMSDINSYIVFASTITNVTLKLQKLINEYEDYITKTGALVIKKPYAATYYYNSHMRLKSSIDRLKTSIVGFSAAGINVLKASMDEKFKLLYQIDATINSMRYIMHSSTNYIKYCGREAMIFKNANEIFTEEFKSRTSKKLADNFNKPIKL